MRTRLKTEARGAQADQGRDRGADRRASGPTRRVRRRCLRGPHTGRWFIVMRAPGRATTTTRRRAPDGSRLTTREQALIAKGQWASQLARGEVAVGRERFETYWPRYLRHAKGEMTHGSWEDVHAHGSKRLLPYFTGMPMSKLVVAVVRDWRATILESVEAGEWARK